MTVPMRSLTKALEKAFLSLLKSLSGKLKTLISVFVFIITTLLNQLGTQEYFTCPTERYYAAGIIFFVAPGVILLLLILIASNRLRMASIRCCKTEKDESEICKSPPVCCSKELRDSTLFAVGYGVLACSSWVVATFMFTETFSCIRLGPAPRTGNATDVEIFNSKKGIENATSKLIGLCILLGVVVLVMIIYFAYICCYATWPETDSALQSMDRYDKLKAQAKKDAFEELTLINSKNVAVKEMVRLTGVAEQSDTRKELQSIPSDAEISPKGTGERIPLIEIRNTKDGTASNETSSDDAASGGIADIAKGGTISREKIEEIRKKLIEQHPYLENPLNKRLPLRQRESDVQHI